MNGLRIKELRKQMKLTQKQLADRINVDCSTVTKWETGKANPDFEKQKFLADFFDVSVDYLLGRVDKNDIIYKTTKETYYIDKFSKLNLEEQKKLFDNELTPQEDYILSCFRNMSEQGKDYILQTIDIVKEKYKRDSLPDERVYTSTRFDDNEERIAAFGGIKENDEDIYTT